MQFPWSCSLPPSLVEDTLDSILGGEDDEAEEDAVISQVLDEIGIEVTGKVRNIVVSVFVCIH